jgi:hypothetical protein
MDSSHNIPVGELTPALLTTFRQRASPILARERGLTAGCVVKLNRLAREIGIPETQIEAAIHSLTSAPTPPPLAPDPKLEKFRQRLRKDLEGKSRTILGPTIESKIIEAAQRKYALTEAAARQTFAEVAAELGLRRISADEAVRSLTTSIDQAIGDSVWLAKESRDRLRGAGLNWGLELEVVDELIDEKLAANRADQSQKIFWTRALLVGTGSAVALAIVTLVVVMLNRGSLNRPSFAEKVSPQSPAEASPGVATVPTWWDVELTLAVAKARGKVADFEAIYDGLIAEQPAARAQAYVGLVALARRVPINRADLDLLEGVIRGSYALDPDEPSAAKLRGSLLALIPTAGDPPAKSPAEFEAAYWSAQAAWRCLSRVGLSTERAAALRAALSQRLGTPLARSLPPLEAERTIGAALTTRLYQLLATAALKHPRDVPLLQNNVARQAATYLSDEAATRLETAFLSAALSSPQAPWQEYAELIEASATSRDPLAVLRMLEVYERTSDEGLRDELGELLTARADVHPKTMSTGDVARAVRQALGASATIASSERDRWAVLRNRAAAPLARGALAADKHEQLLVSAVEFAKLGTLAAALAQGETGFALFDDVLRREAEAADDSSPAERASGDAFSPPEVKRAASKTTPTQQQAFERLVAQFVNFTAVSPVQRESNMRALAQAAYEIDDLAPAQAAALAKYILATKPDSEQAAILKPLAEIRRWKHLRLAIADALERAAPSPAQLAALSAALLGGERSLSASELQLALKRHVWEELQSSDRGGTNLRQGKQLAEAEQAADDMLKTYRLRARLLGVAPTDYHAAEIPSQALELGVTALARDLSASKPTAEEAAQLARLPNELVAIDYLAMSDLARTVALAHDWRHFSARRLSQARPELAAQAEQIVGETDRAVAAGANVLVQLREAERGNLRLWLLAEVE